MSLIHWQITFEREDGTIVAQRPYQHDGTDEETARLAREFWSEIDAPVVRAYPLCEVVDGCHATDGQRLTHHEEHRAALEREAQTL